MFLLTDFSFINSFSLFSPMLTSLLFLFPVVVWSLGFWVFLFCVFFSSSFNLTAFLSSFSSLPGLGVEVCLLSTRSSVGGQEHVKGQAGGRLDLKASPG